MKKYIVRICVAVSILVGHVLAGILLFFLQDSVTCGNAEKLLLAEIASVQRSISVANSANEPEFMYLFTEYDAVGEGGGIIIADGLHDIRCGKRVESCRTLEDAGIDINKYRPLRLSEAYVFGVDCHFAYLKDNESVIVAYIPVMEQVQQRNVNVFSALGVSFIISVLFFFLVPFVIRLFTKETGEMSVPGDKSGVGGASRLQEENAAGVYNADGADTIEDDYDIVMPKEENLSADEDSPEVGETDYNTDYNIEDNQPDVPESAVKSSVDEQESPAMHKDDEITDFADYVSKMQELKRAAHQLGEEKLFKMADYLEKCGKAVLAGSKDTDKFMAEIDSKTPIAIKYYANCVQKKDDVPQSAGANVPEDAQPIDAQSASVVEATSAESEAVAESKDSAELTESVESEESAVSSVPEQKLDMAPAELFAELEAIYAGAVAADKNAVSDCIATLSRVNLPRKLAAVFPELTEAAVHSNFARIKTIIDSLRTGHHAS